jgi:hypothetical protein
MFRQVQPATRLAQLALLQQLVQQQVDGGFGSPGRASRRSGRGWLPVDPAVLMQHGQALQQGVLLQRPVFRVIEPAGYLLAWLLLNSCLHGLASSCLAQAKSSSATACCCGFALQPLRQVSVPGLQLLQIGQSRV